MGETTDQIERHIYEKRNELGENISELQQKVKTTFDWRAQFQQRPMTLMGAALGGGLLVALLLPARRSPGRANRRRREQPESEHSAADLWKSAEPQSRQDRRLEYRSEGRSPFAEKTANTWDSVRDALLTTAITRLTAFVEELLPGFHDQFRRRQNERRQYQAQSQRSGPNWRRPNGPEDLTDPRPS